MKLSHFITIIVLIAASITIYFNIGKVSPIQQLENEGGPTEKSLHPLTIEYLKKGEYPGSNLVIEQTLDPGENYQRYIVSYKSEGLKIYALLTVPEGGKPDNGWPVIIFNHGYIPPQRI